MTNNKDKIMEAAMSLFHNLGFQATGVEEILSSSGVCKSNFYYHFKSKEELGVKVIERMVQHMRRKLLEPSLDNEELAPARRVERLFEQMLDFCEEHDLRKGCFFGNLSLELSGRFEELRKPLSGFFSELEDKLTRTLDEGLRRGELTLSGLGPAELALPLVSLLQGGVLLAKTHRDSKALRDSIRLLQVWIGEERGVSYGR